LLSLRSTNGYKLASLRHHDDPEIELARIITRDNIDR
jgi:hypothetical protein